MPLSIKDPETEALARKLASTTGESITVATRKALEDRLQRLGAKADGQDALLDDLASIRKRWSRLPVLDDRSGDEIIGYDSNGLPR
jgi:antitoxin VapB